MKTQAQAQAQAQAPAAASKAGAPSAAPARLSGERAPMWEQDRDTGMAERLAEWATQPVQRKPVVDTGYGDIVAAAREYGGGQRIAAGQPVVQRRVEGAQSRVTISRPDDPLEQEADRVADIILRMPAPGAASATVTRGAPRAHEIQRKCAAGCMCTSCGTKRHDEDALTVVHAKQAPGASPGTVPQALAALRGPGEGLDDATRAFFEPRFGVDLGHVTIHRDGQAAEAARALGARAFTHGAAIAFDRGQFDPVTDRGRRLLAHELTHVVQQAPMIARDTSIPGADSAEGNKVSRGANAGADCERGHRLGENVPSSANPTPTTVVYLIWGTWQAGDDASKFVQRTCSDWIRWRFSGISSEQTAQVLQYMLRMVHGDATGKPGCQIYIWVDFQGMSDIRRLAGEPEREKAKERKAEERKAEGERAEKREDSAGLGEVRAAVGGKQSGTGKAGTDPDQKPGSGKGGTSTVPLPELPPDAEEGDKVAATDPALPAEISGPELEAPGAIGTYRMRLDYTIAGPTLLAQAAEAMNRVEYHWERFDINDLVLKGMKGKVEQQLARTSGEEVGKTAAAKRRAGQKAENLAEDVKSSAADLATAKGSTPGEVISNAIANKLSLELLPASAIVQAGGVALGALADLLGGPTQEREIPFPKKQGYYMIRCIARPAPQGDRRRAPSVKSKIVEVRSEEYLAKNVLDMQTYEVAKLESALEDARSKQPPDPALVAELEAKLKRQRLTTEGSAASVFERTVKELEEALKTATGSQKRRLEEQLQAAKAQLELSTDRAKKMIGAVYRPRAALASSETGETYPLVLQLGARDKEGSRFVWELSDVTSKHGLPYTGYGSSEGAAAWDSVEKLAVGAGYGHGTIVVRMPADVPFEPKERSLRSHPVGPGLARERLNDLVTVLMILGLFVPGVGEAAAIIGGALAADRLITRAQAGTLYPDAALVGDILGVLGGIAQSAQIIGKLRVVRAEGRFVAAVEGADTAAIENALKAFKGAATFEQRAQMANQIFGLGGLIWGDAMALKELFELEGKELRGEITHGEARRQRVGIFARAVRDNYIAVAGDRFRSKERSGEKGVSESKETPAEKSTAPPAKAPGAKTAEPPSKAPEKPPEPPAKSAPEKPVEPPPPEKAGEPPAKAQGEKPAAPSKEASATPKEKPPEATPTGERPPDRVPLAVTPDGLHVVYVKDKQIIRCSHCDILRKQFREVLDNAQSDPKRQERATKLSEKLAEFEAEENAAIPEGEIRQRAYDIWEKRAKTSDEDWHEAKRQLESERGSGGAIPETEIKQRAYENWKKRPKNTEEDWHEAKRQLERERDQRVAVRSANEVEPGLRELAGEMLAPKIGLESTEIAALLKPKGTSPAQVQVLHARLGKQLLKKLSGAKETVIELFMTELTGAKFDPIFEASDAGAVKVREVLLNVLVEVPDVLESLVKHPDAIGVIQKALAIVAKRSVDEVVGAPKPQQTTPGLRPDQTKISQAIAKTVPTEVRDGKVKQQKPRQKAFEFDIAKKDQSGHLDAYLEKLYKEAAEAQTELTNLATKIANDPKGPKGKPGSRDRLKRRERSKEKIAADYGGDPTWLVDLAGSKIEYKTLDDLYQGLEVAKNELGDKIVYIKDRFVEPADSGYRDILLNVKTSNGHIAELRFHLESIDKFAGIEHATYEVRRSLEAMAKTEKRDLTREEKALITTLNQVTQPIFEKAMREGLTAAP